MVKCICAKTTRSEGRLVGVTAIELGSQSLHVFDGEKIQ